MISLSIDTLLAGRVVEQNRVEYPVSIYVKKGEKADLRKKYWIRPTSLNITANTDELAELFDKCNSVPFDDRVNRRAEITDIRRAYVEDFLRESNACSAKYRTLSKMSG